MVGGSEKKQVEGVQNLDRVTLRHIQSCNNQYIKILCQLPRPCYFWDVCKVKIFT